MNRRHMKNERRMRTNATASRSIRFSRGVDGLLVWSNTTNPSPPIVNRKLEARPSIIYWPLTRYCINATWNKCKYVVNTFHNRRTSRQPFCYVSFWCRDSISEDHNDLVDTEQSTHFWTTVITINYVKCKYNDELLDSYMNKDFNNFWHCWRKKTCSKSPRTSSVAGLTKDTDIANKFADYFAALFDSRAQTNVSLAKRLVMITLLPNILYMPILVLHYTYADCLTWFYNMVMYLLLLVLV